MPDKQRNVRGETCAQTMHYVRRPGCCADRSPQVARKTPSRIRSLSQDATAWRTSIVSGHSSIGSSFDNRGLELAPLSNGACPPVVPGAHCRSYLV